MKNLIQILCVVLLFFTGRRAKSIGIKCRFRQGQNQQTHLWSFCRTLGRCIYGGFYVGEDNTKIKHTNGVRNDVVDALKKLKIPNLRWPGGCFADTYHWKDGIGPKDKRPTIVNRWWGGVTEDNSFGTHNFLDMCELIGTEPYLSG